ncbi:MAG: DoxX family protein [Chlorobi bacterium]|nr:DoxX family protein [Chlorobiota bacterium]
MKIIRLASRIIIGVVFIFSGFVKAVDPLGSAYKFNDYFTAFGMEWLHHISLPLSFVLSAAEFLIGISLFFGIRLKTGSWASLIFMGFFTILTFFLAIYNPVTDCGCFGDALILTNWQTFFKNIIFLIPTIVVFLSLNKFPELMKPFSEWLFISFFAIVILGVSLYGYNHLPIFDFRPYKTGVYIPDAMAMPAGAPQDVYDSKFIYEKDGIQKEFTTDNYPYDDSTWTFVDAKHTLVKKGYTPPIHDFTIETLDGEDITDVVLYDEGYSFLFIAYDLNKTNNSNIENINNLASWANDMGYRFIGLTSSLNDEIENFSDRNNSSFDFYNTDEVTLKTIIRANPGLVLLKNGTILGKWHYKDIPEINELNDNLLAYKISDNRKILNKAKLYNILWLSLLFVILYLVIVPVKKLV